jgi:predicted outer membrane protein
MNRFATCAAVALITVTLVACSSGTPTSPSLAGPTASAGGFAVSDGQSRITLLAADDDPISSLDNVFIGSAAATHQAMIQFAQLGEKNSAHLGVKLFAQQMFQENTEALARLRQSQIWRSAVPQTITLSAAHQTSLSELSASAARGNPMDRLYTDLMTAELPVFIAQLQAWSASGSARALRDHWADLAARLTAYLDDLREVTARVH